MIYLINLSEKDYLSKKNTYLKDMVTWIKSHGGEKIIAFSVAFESKLLGFETDEEREKYKLEVGGESALEKIILEGYKCLNLIHFFTCGADEVRCWTIRKGTHAPQAAGVIHTDMERGFISADIFKYDDLIELGSEANVKKEGKIRIEGKKHEMIDGEIVYVKFNVSDPTKKKK